MNKFPKPYVSEQAVDAFEENARKPEERKMETKTELCNYCKSPLIFTSLGEVCSNKACGYADGHYQPRASTPAEPAAQTPKWAIDAATEIHKLRCGLNTHSHPQNGCQNEIAYDAQIIARAHQSKPSEPAGGATGQLPKVDVLKQCVKYAPSGLRERAWSEIDALVAYIMAQPALPASCWH